MWASVNLGVFLCITCGSHHRSLGTHISKPKGCTGTYWWGPDELENMKTIGNAGARRIYGNKVPTGLTPTSNPMEWRKYLTDKYMHKKYAPAPTPGPTSLPATQQVASRDSCVHNDKVESSLPSLVKEDVSSSSSTDFMSFGREQGNKNGTIHHGGEDFFSNFGDSSAIPIISDNRTFGTKDVDLLGLSSYAGNMIQTKKDAVSSQSRGMMKNQDFFAEFGL